MTVKKRYTGVVIVHVIREYKYTQYSVPERVTIIMIIDNSSTRLAQRQSSRSTHVNNNNNMINIIDRAHYYDFGRVQGVRFYLLPI